MKTIITTVLVVITMTGCASYQTVMVNKDGEYRTCAAEGRGLIGASIANGVYSRCVNEAGNAGYAPLTALTRKQ